MTARVVSGGDTQQGPRRLNLLKTKLSVRLTAKTEKMSENARSARRELSCCFLLLVRILRLGPINPVASLEMICADFLAGANLDGGDPHVLMHSMTRFFQFLPSEQRHAFAQEVAAEVANA